jgi:hypothetical protein
MQGATLLAGDDPYDAIGSTFKPKTVANQQMAPEFDPEKPIMRAIAVVPSSEDQVEVRRAQPVGPMDESGSETLLQNEPPAPLDFSEDH